MQDRYEHINLDDVSARIQNYLRFAPSYPVEILNTLRSDFGLNENDIIADIGCGVGYLSNLFVKESKSIHLIESREEDTAILKEVYKEDHVNIHLASAQNTPLAQESVDLILVGHAFHRFAQKPTKQEFLRIIKPNGLVCLVWQQRNLNQGFQRDYENILKSHLPHYTNITQTHMNLEAIDSFFDPYPFQVQKFPNFKIYSIDGIKGYYLSSHYSSDSSQETNQAILSEIEKTFNKHQSFNKIRFDYNTMVFIGKIK